MTVVPDILYFPAIDGHRKKALTPEFIRDHGLVLEEFGGAILLFGAEEDARAGAHLLFGCPKAAVTIVTVSGGGLQATQDLDVACPGDYVTPPPGECWYGLCSIGPERLGVPDIRNEPTGPDEAPSLKP